MKDYAHSRGDYAHSLYNPVWIDLKRITAYTSNDHLFIYNPVWIDLKDGNYPLLSEAIKGGLFHPRCKDSTSTYYEGITTLKPVSREELQEIEEREELETKQKHAERQVQRFKRREKYSLDPDNKRFAKARKNEWQEKSDEYSEKLEKLTESGIIKNNKEMLRNQNKDRTNISVLSEERFQQLTIEARKKGAKIIRGGVDVEKHLDDVGADASIIGDVILFRSKVCISEVLEETYHFKQNLQGLNNDKCEPLRTYLNEIDAKKYLLENVKKYKIPRSEVELTKRQLEYYQRKLKKYYNQR